MKKEIKGLVFIIGSRNDYSKDMVFESAEDWDFVVNHKLHSDFTNLDSHESIDKWVEDVEKALKEKRTKYGPSVELYIDTEGVGTVWSTPAIVRLTRSIYDDDDMAGTYISIIDFDGDNYTNVELKKF